MTDAERIKDLELTLKLAAEALRLERLRGVDSRREKIATACLAGMMHIREYNYKEDMVQEAVEYADALIAKLNEMSK